MRAAGGRCDAQREAATARSISRRRRSPRLATLLAVLAVGMMGGQRSGASGDAEAQERPISGDKELTVSIAIPLSGAYSERAISYYGKEPKFHVLVTNISDRPQRIWEDWNSWGYYMLSFEITAPNGKVWHIEKGPHAWKRNFPSWWTLPPHESQVLEVYFADSKTWSLTPFPRPLEDPETYTLRAIFEIGPSAEAKKNGVWTGRIMSPAEKYVFYSGK